MSLRSRNAKSLVSLFCLKRSPLVFSCVSCYFIPAFSCPAFSRLSFSRPTISCPAHGSINFMSCNFMPCKLVRQFHVRHFHVQHFQRPRACLLQLFPHVPPSALQLVETLSFLVRDDVSATGHFASPVLQRGTACRQTFELLLL